LQRGLILRRTAGSNLAKRINGGAA